MKAWLYRRYFLYPLLRRHIQGRVVDVGCGIGDFLAYYRNAVGLDVDADNIEFCRSRGLEAYPITAAVYPFAENTFDSAILDNVLEHLVDPDLTVTEISRVLRPDGTLVVGVPGIVGYAADPDHKVFYSESALIQYLEAREFRVLRTIHTPVRSAYLHGKISPYCVYAVCANCKKYRTQQALS